MGNPSLFEVRGGVSIGTAGFISGEGAPGGSGYPDSVGKGSIYLDTLNGSFYQKKTSGTGADKWVKIQNQDDISEILDGKSWREPAKVIDSTAYADLAAAEAVVNTGMIDGVSVSTNDRILFTGITGAAKNVFIVNGTPGSGATLVEDGNAVTSSDSLYVNAGSNAGRQYTYNGTDWVKINEASETEAAYIRAFIGKSGNGNETPDYPSTHVVADNDSLETAIGKLDDEIGPAISGQQVRANNPISDQDINLNIKALDAAIGSTPPSTNLISGDASVTANLSTLDTKLFLERGESWADGITAITTVDSVNVDTSCVVEWVVHVVAQGNQGNVEAAKITAIHNGIGPNDATETSFEVHSIKKLGAQIQGLAFTVDLFGTGTSQVMRLRAESTSAVNIAVRRSITVDG